MFMNIITPETEFVTAKACGCKNREAITYSFSESFHSLCLDKKAIVEAEINACRKLLKYANTESERSMVRREISELELAFGLLS
jgi:hypothetical protein